MTPKQTPNNDPIIHLLNNTNEKSLPNLLQNMSFQNYKLKSKLSFIVDFTFKVGNKISIRLSNNRTKHRREKTKKRFGFSKVSLKTVIIHLTENFFSNGENVAIKQTIGIPMRENLKCIIKGRIATLNDQSIDLSYRDKSILDR